MALPSTFEYQGWKIRYSLTTSNDESSSKKTEVKNVVFVHGTPWSSAVFKPTIDALLAKGSYQILLYDLPGYGESQEYTDSVMKSEDTFSGDTSVKFQAETLAKLLKHVKLDGKDGRPAPSIIAHDIAGAIVLRTHLMHNCNFTGMMLLDANTVLPWGDGFYKLVRAEPKPFTELPPKIYEAMLRAVVQSACNNPKILQSGWEDTLARPWLDPQPKDGEDPSSERQKSFIRQIAQADDADVAEMLDADMYKQVRCDVKIVWGKEDQWIPRHKMEKLIELLDGKAKETVFIPDAGHLVMLDQPARLAIEVYDWLN